MTGNTSPLLSVNNLKTSFATRQGLLPAVDGISFELMAGEALGIVGESGSGKSVTALSLMRLVPSPPSRLVGGEIIFEGEDITKLDDRLLRRIRGRDIAMIFQDPIASLNPVFSVGYQIEETLKLHTDLSDKEIHDKAIEMLQCVGIAAPERRLDEYPHQLSGGMCQRIMIAIALSCSPKLLIADEPTTALDVTTQAQVLDLIKRLRTQFGMALILITHNLAIVADMVEQVAVMYAGKIVEYAPSRALLSKPRHRYTEGLLGSLPKLRAPQSRLLAVEGTMPNPSDLSPGCRFHPRCKFALDRCRQEQPPLAEVEPGHRVACWNPAQLSPARVLQ